MSREGATVYDTGLSSTPAMFMSTLFPEIKADGSIMVTASHLPWNRNGLKFFSCDGGLDKGDIRWILDQAALLHPDICSHEATPPDVAWAKMDLMTFYAHHLKALAPGDFMPLRCWNPWVQILPAPVIWNRMEPFPTIPPIRKTKRP
jgi:phosphomannomutase